MDDRTEGAGGMTSGSPKQPSKLAVVLAAGAVLCALIGVIAWQGSRGAGNYMDLQTKAEKASTGISADDVMRTEGAVAGTSRAETAETAAPAAATTASAAETAESAAEEIPIDFEEIWKTCPDVYAWICIPDTQINYPVCQSGEDKDPDFYLNHRADGTEEFAGSIYSQYYNSKDFRDPNTILYGHDMSNGSMFQNLHFYEKQDFFDQNREVIVYLPDRILHYRVFAAYNTTDEHILMKYDFFQDPAVFEQYIQEVMDGTNMYSGIIDPETRLTGESRILTLSTCNAYEDQRFLVQCLLQE